jgi:histone-lysine N-methyltransferase SETMAR
MLTQPQKNGRVESAQAMLRELAKHQASNFRFLLTGHQSWLFYAYHHETMLAASWDDVDEIERPSHFHEKTMFVIFFNGTGDHTSVILPQEQRMNSTSFIECVIRPLAGFCYPEGTKPHQKRVVVHFDNPPIHNTETVQECLADCGFRKMNYPAYSPDLTPCDFFLFGAMKENFSGMPFASADELFQGVEDFFGGLSADTLHTVFEEWIRRLDLCCEGGGEYVE